MREESSAHCEVRIVRETPPMIAGWLKVSLSKSGDLWSKSLATFLSKVVLLPAAASSLQRTAASA